MRGIVARVMRPEYVALELAVLLLAAGLFAIAIAWRGAAATLGVPLQVPYIVSGGFGGLALLGLGLLLLEIQSGRLDRARDRDDLNELTARAAALLEPENRQ